MSIEHINGLVCAPATKVNTLDRASTNLPRWQGNQRVTGMYVASQPHPEWPTELATLEVALWRGHKHLVGWDGQELWIEPHLAKKLQAGEACVLLLLQKTGAVGGIKPRESYFMLVDQARPHLDQINGGVFASSYGALRSEELDTLCAKHRDMMRIKNLHKAVVVVLGFPDDASDDQVKSVLGSDVFKFFRFPTRPGKAGLARAQLELTKAKALCAQSQKQWDEGTPLRIGDYPVRVEWCRDQSAFEYKKPTRR